MTCPGCGLERHPTSCIDALRAENAKLREALEKIAGWTELGKVRAIARAALQKDQGE